MVVIATTTLIETMQYFIGRSADIDDVIMNTIGGLLGYLLFWIGKNLLGRKHSRTAFQKQD